MAGRGELEQAVMHILWDRPEGATAREVLSAMPSRDLALTTIMTVLGRLGKKGLVSRNESVRPHRYHAVTSREDYIAGTMLEALGQAPDRQAVLTRFLGSVSDTDPDLVRNLLRRSAPRA